VQEQLDTLESRVQDMIELIKRLKMEKTELETTLNRWEKEMHLLQEEKDWVRQRVGKILAAIGHPGAVASEDPG